MRTSQDEIKNKRIAAATTVVVNAVILLLMIFIGSWKMAGEGEGEYPGIEVNLGYDDQGSGDIEPATPIGEETAKDDEDAPAEKTPDPVDEKPSEPVSTPPPAETKAAEPSETLTDPNSDVEIKEKPKEEKPVEKVVEKKPEQPVVKPVEKKVEPKVDNNAVYKPSTSTNATKSGDGTGKQGTAGNQGDDIGKEGNKGVPGGTEGAAVYKGTPGGGNGGVAISGFNGFQRPKVEVPDIPEESFGVYEFSVKIDENGYVTSVTPLQRGLSFEAERKMKLAIQKLRFIPVGENLPPQSEGKISFRVVSSN